MLVWETWTLTCWNISLWIVRVHLRELYRKRGKVGVIPHPARPPPPLSSQNFLLPPLIKILPHQPLKKCLTYIQETTSSQNLEDEPTRVQECYEGSQKRVCGIYPSRGRGVPRIANLFPQRKKLLKLGPKTLFFGWNINFSCVSCHVCRKVTIILGRWAKTKMWVGGSPL